MGSGAFFDDYEVLPGLPKAAYWEALLNHMLLADSVEVIETMGGAGMVMRVWTGVRKNDSNDPDADPDTGPY
jgi:hypothetical protein